MDERGLIQRIQAGDVAAFEQLFRAYHPRLCGFAFSMLRDRAVSEELVQDLFMSIWEKRGRLDVQTSVRAYLFGALRNRALNRSARARMEEQWTELSAQAEGVAAVEYSDIGERVRDAVAALPAACRNALTLRWQEDMSYAEIAETLGVSVKTVENNLARARALLREKLPDLVT
jgi:RNA polymerase sigma-70 factor (ECF subfamily)